MRTKCPSSKLRVLEEIVDRRLAEGTFLPSIRELEQLTGASRQTVYFALRELTDDGVLESSPRRGYRILNSQLAGELLTRPDEAQIAFVVPHWIQNGAANLACSRILAGASKQAARARVNLVYLTLPWNPDETRFSLRALALKSRRITGAMLIGPTPDFIAEQFIEQAGGKVVEVPADGAFRLDLAAIERAVTPRTKAILLNSPNNPTGVVYSRGELAALAALLERKNKELQKTVVLISDEPYRELTYGAEVPYLMALYPHTVVCYSFSKSLSLAGERIGYIAVSPQCADARALFAAVCGAGRALGFVCAPALFQRVAAKCLGQSGDLEAYRANRDLLWEALTSFGFSCIPSEGAFYLFMKSPEPDAAAFAERAKKYELLLVPSDSFGVKGYVRISYCVSRETIQNSLPAFAALAKEYGL